MSSNSTNSNSSTNEADNTAYGVSAAHTQSNPTSGDNLSDVMIFAFLASQPNSPQLAQQDLEQIDPDDLEEMDLQWEMAMLTIRARRFIKRTVRKLDVNGQRVRFDRSKVECYNCHKYETPTENALVAQDGIGGSPPPYTGNFIPFKLDLTFMDEIVESENMDVTTIVTPSNDKTLESNHESANVKINRDVVESKTVRKNNFRPPVIEDWNFDDDSEVEFIPNVEDKTVRPSTEKIKFVKSAREIVEKQKEYNEKGVIDSGCSRHMTGNKCYLTEYEDYDGSFVSFGDGKGRISRKGKIKTGTLDFDNVYFCKELKYNLLLDESQVLLRVPRKDNIYSVDLKSVVPTKELENQLDHKVKVIRSYNGTEFKNSVMNQFCEMKGIKREFSVARTPQQNGVAERKNRTLIEAARTMLVDSKLSTTF
ncbi:putative ribonuclease H-like domain-containing protein [Tanacetum coccineum]